MIKLLKKLFECKHKHTTEGFKQATRYDKPILIDFKECKDCGRVLRCKVSFLEVKTVKPSVVLPPQHITLVTENKDVVTGTLNVAPTVELKMDLTENPGQNRKEAEPPAPVKEPVKMEPAPIIPEQPKVPEMREAEKVEEILEHDPEDGPLTSQSPDPVAPPVPSKAENAEELIDENPIDPAQDVMVEGQFFLKEPRSSINRRRKDLARQRAKAMEALKKTGKAVIKVPGKKQTNNGIPFLDAPDAPSKEDEYN